MCGYPSDKETHTMWHALTPLKNATENFLYYKISTYSGNSGSPIIKRNDGKEYVIGVHIGTDP